MIFYYKIYVASSRYHSNDGLTYHHSLKLTSGSIVEVTLKNQLVLGIVVSKVKKPDFKTKAIHYVLLSIAFSPRQIELILWMMTYYATPSGWVVQQFLPKALLK